MYGGSRTSSSFVVAACILRLPSVLLALLVLGEDRKLSMISKGCDEEDVETWRKWRRGKSWESACVIC